MMNKEQWKMTVNEEEMAYVQRVVSLIQIATTIVLVNVYVRFLSVVSQLHGTMKCQ